MEFRFLWLTSTSEFLSCRELLNAFPYPLAHKHYKGLNPQNLEIQCQQTAACIWSEKEYSLTPKIYRDYLKKHSKPGMLIVDNDAFAYKAFELGFTHCLRHDELDQRFSLEIVNLLAYYFKPHIKPLIFLQKLYLPINPWKNQIQFIEFENIIQIYSENGIQTIETPETEIQTKTPFEWLRVQCEFTGILFGKINAFRIINTIFITKLEVHKQKYYCRLDNDKTFILKPKEYNFLHRYIKSIKST